MLFEFNETKSNIFDLDECYKKGNMFDNIYEEYKNYKPIEIKTNTEEEKLYLNILKLEFAINDLNLYLDINPYDNKVFEIFKKYILLYKKCLKEYESKYQVLDLYHDVFDKYTWINSPWSWEKKNCLWEDTYV
jgi:hypothetical protein